MFEQVALFRTFASNRAGLHWYVSLQRTLAFGTLLGFVLYGYAATRARPVLRDPRLLALIYVDTRCGWGRWPH